MVDVSTLATDVERLLGPTTPQLMVTDPPSRTGRNSPGKKPFSMGVVAF
jgi:hypothetical protein